MSGGGTSGISGGQGNKAGPYFVFRDGSVLSRERLVAQLRKNLSDAGVDSSKFAGHSFRIGAATTEQELETCKTPRSKLSAGGRAPHTSGMYEYPGRNSPSFRRP